jgi:hypothetical protein
MPLQILASRLGWIGHGRSLAERIDLVYERVGRVAGLRVQSTLTPSGLCRLAAPCEPQSVDGV